MSNPLHKNVLFVGGTFNDEGGRRSGLAEKLFNALMCSFEWGTSCTKYLNGGKWSEIEDIDFVPYDQIYWFADVPNDKPKIVSRIKQDNPKCMLITSKNNLDDKYESLEIIGRALKSKSNLLVEFTRSQGMIEMTVWDALGNVYVWRNNNVEQVAEGITMRLRTLHSITRVPSVRVGDAIEAPDRQEFFQFVQEHSRRFHSLVHAVNSDRFVGNLSFRCESGFPSFRDNGLIFVSRRNIDKRDISREGFVAVNPKSMSPVEYYGDHKPSVDTPIQVRLYHAFPKIRYMLHSHVYVEGAPFTKEVIPCGGVEECMGVVLALNAEDDRSFFVVNLLGHGSIIGMDHPSRLSERPLLGLPIKYEARPIPERIDLR